MSTARIGSTAYPAPFSFHGWRRRYAQRCPGADDDAVAGWIGANKSALAPPVGNKLMLGAGTAVRSQPRMRCCRY